MNVKLTRCLFQVLSSLCILISLLLASCSTATQATVAPTVLAPATLPPTIVASPTLAPTQPPTQSAVETYSPTTDWRTSTPEAQGMDSQKLADMLEAVQAQDLSLDSLLIFRNGYLVSETYFGNDQPGTRREIYSCTKSFVSTLIGIAIDQGYIDSTDQRLLDFFPGRTFANLDQNKKDMTLADVLTMRTGLAWEEGDPAIMALYRSPDWVKYVLDLPMAGPPGSQFNYCSGCSHLLSAALQQATGMKVRDFAEQALFKPLGIVDARWNTDSQGIPIGGWGLQLAPREMAKLGYLYLKEGVWDNRQIISKGWVKNATQTHTPTDIQEGYGYQWWTYPSLLGYAALGRFGQTIFVLPESNLIIVTTSGSENSDAIFDKLYALVEQDILPAVQD
jgi:CubicO group peptidase (beta-lactamase class C family)